MKLTPGRHLQDVKNGPFNVSLTQEHSAYLFLYKVTKNLENEFWTYEITSALFLVNFFLFPLLASESRDDLLFHHRPHWSVSRSLRSSRNDWSNSSSVFVQLLILVASLFARDKTKNIYPWNLKLTFTAKFSSMLLLFLGSTLNAKRVEKREFLYSSLKKIQS